MRTGMRFCTDISDGRCVEGALGPGRAWARAPEPLATIAVAAAMMDALRIHLKRAEFKRAGLVFVIALSSHTLI